ncbi:MAG: ligase-associated DNA damage response DEXH box helicase [Lysobacteraceae bacterium]
MSATTSAPRRRTRAAPPAPLTRTAALRRLQDWFAARGWTPLPFQREAWKRRLAGESGLIHTPTGSGKTLAALGGPLVEALSSPRPTGDGPALLWITPLRALAVDTVRALGEAVEGLGVGWTVGLRTGDASAGDKRRARNGRFDALVVTPESLALLLSHPDSAARLAGARSVVVDEWHELLGNKRGVLLQLCLARLRATAPNLCIWGLSATLGNLDEARDALLPWAPGAAIVSGAPKRALRIDTLLPGEGERFPWAGHLGLSQLSRVMAALQAAGTSLLFTNTRAQAELWHRALESVWPDDPATLALHHGSLDPALRRAAEDGLRSGRVRCVVATSSLDLGVDFPAVDQVLQIGSPTGLSRLLQRGGRARHRPGESGTVVCVPTHALELAESAAARAPRAHGRVESRPPPRLSLDVLAQHLLTVALGGGPGAAPRPDAPDALPDGFDADALHAEVRGTHAFAALDATQWDDVLAFLVQGGRALSHYPEYRRLVRDVDGRHRVLDRAVARRHRLSIGTIASDGSIAVKFLKGGGLGSVEETFIGRMRPGERFQFAGRTLELVQLRDMTAYVRVAKAGDGAVPRWQGGRMPLSTALGREVESVLAGLTGREALERRALAPLLALQARLSALPAPDRLLAEWVEVRGEGHLCVYPFAGRSVHEALGALLGLRWARRAPNTFAYAANDYGFVLSAEAPAAPDPDLLRDLLSPERLAEDLRESVNLAELARRKFREVARVAGLLPPSLPGGTPRSLRQLQASSGLLYDVLQRHDPDHLLLHQAEREALADDLAFARLDATLREAGERTLDLHRPRSLTPLSFPLWADSLRGRLSTEDWTTRVQRAAAKLERRHG